MRPLHSIFVERRTLIHLATTNRDGLDQRCDGWDSEGGSRSEVSVCSHGTPQKFFQAVVRHSASRSNMRSRVTVAVKGVM